MLPPACDYKRLLDGDNGPLTGGMGSYTPTKYVTPELWDKVRDEIMVNAVQGMAAEGTPYRGVLYAGLMLTENGPKVLEFNCRMGDPEAQVLLPRLETPLEDIAMAIAEGDLSRAGTIQWSDDVAVGVGSGGVNFRVTVLKILVSFPTVSPSWRTLSATWRSWRRADGTGPSGPSAWPRACRIWTSSRKDWSSA
jgi:hypothetical protein